MSKLADSGFWRRIIGSFIILLFAWQIAVPLASAESPGAMQCCRRMHGKMACCPHSSKNAGGPAVTDARGCSGDCAAVAPLTSPLIVRPEHQVSGIEHDSLSPVLLGLFIHAATFVSSNLFQRPPPVVS